MEYKAGKATVRVHGTIDKEALKQATETFIKKAVRKSGRNEGPKK